VRIAPALRGLRLRQQLPCQLLKPLINRAFLPLCAEPELRLSALRHFCQGTDECFVRLVTKRAAEACSLDLMKARNPRQARSGTWSYFVLRHGVEEGALGVDGPPMPVGPARWRSSLPRTRGGYLPGGTSPSPRQSIARSRRIRRSSARSKVRSSHRRKSAGRRISSISCRLCYEARAA
jgi:hypothetical protein